MCQLRKLDENNGNDYLLDTKSQIKLSTLRILTHIGELIILDDDQRLKHYKITVNNLANAFW